MLFLTRAEVESSLDLDLLIDRLADGFGELSAGRASVPPRVAAFVPDAGFLAAMPGYVGETLATKLVSVFSGNHDRGLPSHQALIVLFESDSGTPLAVMDGTYITAMRTAGASAVATRTLAREDARVLAVVGAGVQGRAHLEMVKRVRRFDEIRVASRNPAHVHELASAYGAIETSSFEEAIRGANVVCMCTDSSEPVIDGEWLSPGAHVTSVGASPDGGELDARTVGAGLLVVESRVAFEPPPVGAAELDGLDPDAAAELGEVLSGTRPGRTAADQITVYKSMGHAVEDAVAARLAYEGAVNARLGVELTL
jgi:ornithine cyclodeaminase/alanine dehydrogenase-like protein (mu-crystallin family)